MAQVNGAPFIPCSLGRRVMLCVACTRALCMDGWASPCFGGNVDLFRWKECF